MLCAIGSFPVHGPIIFWYLTRVFVYHAILAVQFFDYSMENFELKYNNDFSIIPENSCS